MFPIVFMLIATDIITGRTLFERTTKAPTAKSYHARVTAERDKALDKAWEAAGLGEYRITYCIDTDTLAKYSSSANEFRYDVVRALNRINALMAKEHQPTTSYRCIDIDWSRL